jgi:hypothetical protein
MGIGCRARLVAHRIPVKKNSMTTPTAIAEAFTELEAYDDEEHRAVLELVRELLGGFFATVNAGSRDLNRRRG